MKEKVYIETSFISFLTSKPSDTKLTAVWQAISHEWWQKRRTFYDLFISEIVIDEVTKGDRKAAEKRVALCRKIPVLDVSEESLKLAKMIVTSEILPKKAANDIFHIAVAACNQIDYLLTWNCKHLDNAELKPKVRKLLSYTEYTMPEICTPFELFGEDDDEK